MIASAYMAHQARHSSGYKVHTEEEKVSLKEVKARKDNLERNSAKVCRIV